VTTTSRRTGSSAIRRNSRRPRRRGACAGGGGRTDLVEGRVVKTDKDGALLDIGCETEGVTPSRELSIKHDVDPHDFIKSGERMEALVLHKDNKEGRADKHPCTHKGAGLQVGDVIDKMTFHIPPMCCTAR